MAAGAVAGGAAGAFLQNKNAGDRAGQGRDRAENRGENRGDRQGNRTENRGNRQENRAASRPDRIENRGQRTEQRSSRRDEVRNQFRDHHPRYDFWRDHPHAARWRWNRPYRWATWGAIAGFFPWGWGSSVSYNYGDNVYYEGDEVYYGDEAVATTEEYAEQAQDLAASAPEVDDSADWMTLGVFAITQDGEASGAPPTLFVQLAVNKQGIIAGTFQNTADGESKEVEGMIDQKSQRSAWALAGTSWPIMETGIANLTEDTAAALVHFENGETQQWLLVRLEEPKEGS